MSTIKSSNEHLTLNADGSSKDIKLQANASEKVIVKSDGKVGIGVSSPAVTLELAGNGGAVRLPNGGELQFGNANNLIIGNSSNNYLACKTNSSERMRIDSAGNVGIGATSPSTSLHLKDNATAANTKLTVERSSLSYTGEYAASHCGTVSNNEFDLHTNNTMRMRIDSSGRVLIGTTSSGSVNPNGMHIRASSYGGYALQVVHTAGTGDGHGILVDIPNYTGSGGQYMLRFYTNGGETGSIKSTQSSTAYNTSSDYRLKENVDYDWDATTRLKQLKPARFNFIADDTNTLVDGFIAHEVSSVVPEAISGAKDAMTAEVLYAESDELPEGKNVGDVKTAAAIDPQGIDQSKLVPLLVKTIQELEARITALES